MTTDKKNIGLIAFLLMLIVAIGYLSYQNAKDYSELKNAFELEKIELELELDDVIRDYDNAISRKENISKKLKDQLYKIVRLRDTIKSLKSYNYGLIRKYRRRIARLESQNKKLFVQVDSLNNLNNELLAENVTVKEELGEKEELNTSLVRKNKLLFNRKKNLEEKVAKAKIIRTSQIIAIAMKESSNGKLSSTSKLNDIGFFKVSFDLLENKFAGKGLKSICIQILDENRNIVSRKGITVIRNKSKIIYSDLFVADYRNKETGLVSLIKVDRENIQRGVYTIKVFVEGIYSGETIVKLR
ncbi:hypothetical protein [Tenacibaculum maritimum]|uniref:Uncharacterized protein n=1 Tax=Tenacibaculum maritimum NCIMB 2154 TaxID=1349785 RepID=A0A2H1E621_9FLAO|nr:hypothetical protein [Tenacibaculum maritimum]MCD9562230.1 hypothetical protein [Tenacibaculum maritimum]MCD9564623.1 hypothetical protein [Tenacibaculum maritimum]MCD9578353.1 hypothetical protein [Tenacibaculum maritimum]MCD9581297.1 hypothetical protein [Tenacibaculum maritimum]MCD9584135.1 hypothetical protein [Tenacibaculum maritimum]